MLKLFMRVVFGGLSNKREATLFAFLIGVAWVSFTIWKVAQGVDMSAVVGLVTAYALGSLAALTGTTALHHIKRPGEGGDTHPAELVLPPFGGDPGDTGPAHDAGPGR